MKISSKNLQNFTSEKAQGCCRTPQWVIGYFGRDKKPRIRLFSMGSKMVSSPSQITEVSEIFENILKIINLFKWHYLTKIKRFKNLSVKKLYKLGNGEIKLFTAAHESIAEKSCNK